MRPGENHYTYSVVGLDPRTGALREWRQILKSDAHDWDVAAAPALITTPGSRALMVVGGKDGHLYGFDRHTGRR